MRFDAVIIIGPCRSGTTFVFNALASPSYTGLFQPIKHGIRSALAAEPPKLSLKEFAGEPVVIKEAFGPYDLEEVTFDPIEKVLDTLKPRRPLLISVMRSPEQCLSSWQRSFFANGEGPVPEVFNGAYMNTVQLREKHHAWLESADLILDDAAGFPITLTRIQKSLGIEAIGPAYARSIKVRDPQAFEVSGLLNKAMSGRHYNRALAHMHPQADLGESFHPARSSFEHLLRTAKPTISRANLSSASKIDALSLHAN
ncbi:sulfotransferase family protein [Pseudomonas vanderleydeniana]|uniref:Sulfotransferase family protein n=1 Tax=Pseudomonas vanderleydeniana TaxID=2745495 RepID=A0A9E6PFX1_9PSED|nr:sulfotransferase family protein [Pseudomonas vanderleydeniana]QXI26092.1 sulfotransferase family protein [Pseudomonas vanderleydeniana]